LRAAQSFGATWSSSSTDNCYKYDANTANTTLIPLTANRIVSFTQCIAFATAFAQSASNQLQFNLTGVSLLISTWADPLWQTNCFVCPTCFRPESSKTTVLSAAFDCATDPAENRVKVCQAWMSYLVGSQMHTDTSFLFLTVAGCEISELGSVAVWLQRWLLD
jgi:hypothetical protein